jgi:hypothetical protein
MEAFFCAWALLGSMETLWKLSMAMLSNAHQE